jgi:hypothetical protein
MHSFMQLLQYIYISLVDYLALWHELKVNSTLDIKESDEYCFLLWFQHVSSLRTIYATQRHFSQFLPHKTQHYTSVTCIPSQFHTKFSVDSVL